MKRIKIVSEKLFVHCNSNRIYRPNLDDWTVIIDVQKNLLLLSEPQHLSLKVFAVF